MYFCGVCGGLFGGEPLENVDGLLDMIGGVVLRRNVDGGEDNVCW